MAQFPDRAKLKIRKEHYVLAELDRLVPELSAFVSVWDCPVPGGCSIKKPDRLYMLSDRYLHIEVDEFGHLGNDCFDEDTRLEIIAADVGLPGLVLRLDPDHPACFSRKRKSNGETVEVRLKKTFDLLLQRAAEAVRAFLAGPAPVDVQRVLVRAA